MRFEEFAAARSPALLRYARLLSGDREAARDIVQEVLTKALIRWDRIARVDEPYGYVRTMVTNEFLSAGDTSNVEILSTPVEGGVPPDVRDGAGEPTMTIVGHPTWYDAGQPNVIYVETSG